MKSLNAPLVVLPSYSMESYLPSRAWFGGYGSVHETAGTESSFQVCESQYSYFCRFVHRTLLDDVKTRRLMLGVAAADLRTSSVNFIAGVMVS